MSKYTMKLCPYCHKKVKVGPAGNIYKHRGYETITPGICDGWGQKYDRALAQVKLRYIPFTAGAEEPQ